LLPDGLLWAFPADRTNHLMALGADHQHDQMLKQMRRNSWPPM
jgi:hypothetical protein